MLIHPLYLLGMICIFYNGLEFFYLGILLEEDFYFYTAEKYVLQKRRLQQSPYIELILAEYLVIVIVYIYE